MNMKSSRFAEIFQRKKEGEVFRNWFLLVLHHATYWEILMSTLSIIAAIIHGSVLPLFTVVFGSVIDSFGSNEFSNSNFDSLRIIKWFFVLGSISFLSSFIQVRFQLVFAQRICHRIRLLYIDSLLNQEMAFFDENEVGELAGILEVDSASLQNALGDKLSSIIQLFSLFITGFVVAFIYSWKLTLILLGVTPLLILSGVLFGKLAGNTTRERLKAYGQASAVVNEVITLIKTVTAFNGQEEEAKRYEILLNKAYKAGVKISAFTGGALGLGYFLIFCTFAIAFKFGVGQVQGGAMKPGDLIITAVSVFFSTTAIGKTAQGFKLMITAQEAAPRLFEIIYRKSKIDSKSETSGLIPDNFSGAIDFKDASFQYPQKNNDPREKYVLRNFNMSFLPNSSTALVGPSGAGKSTIFYLIERFYDTQNGQILLDGVDIKKLNTRWLRNQIGYVGQSATLFQGSIRENISMGAGEEVIFDDLSLQRKFIRKAVSDEEIFRASKIAHAHDFIMELPDGYDTVIGERGSQLSGGQRQRICIARAIVRNPKILLLDECSSALDGNSEKIVEKALEEATSGRTTIKIAHRLSTIRNCNSISVIEDGSVIEQGSHEELMRLHDNYWNMHCSQQLEPKPRSSMEGSSSSTTVDTTEEQISFNRKGNIPENETQKKNLLVDTSIISRLFHMNKGEMVYIILGIIGAAVGGASFPVIAIIAANNVDLLFPPFKNGEIAYWTVAFVVVGFISFTGYFFQFYMLGISGERLTRNIRSKTFRNILKQEVAFFEMKENTVGALSSCLSRDATSVNELTGHSLGAVAMILSTFVTGFVIAFASCWRIAFVVLSILPLLGVSEAYNAKMVSGFDRECSDRYQAAESVVVEALQNIESVREMGIEDEITKKYEKEIQQPLYRGEKIANISAITFGIAEFLGQAFWGIAFWGGSAFLEKKECDLTGLMKAISGLLFAGTSLGQASLFLPDFGKAKSAAYRLFALLDRATTLPNTKKGLGMEDIWIEPPSIKMQDVTYTYLNRPAVPVIKNISLFIPRGSNVAIVGQSGSGKSTIGSLILRFYDPDSGNILMNEEDLRSLDVSRVRENIGIVLQDVDLFTRSIRDNIAYGLSAKDGQPVTDSMIYEAAKLAAAHEFIASLPNGFDTIVGQSGHGLSGGQKQRIALARALIRKPSVMILDEATSALDSVTESNLQGCLEDYFQDRTTISISHRMATIQSADIIYVVENGQIQESGSAEELLQRNGIYATLMRSQLRE